MKIKWILRLKNKITLTAVVAGVVALVYQALGWFGAVPAISEVEIINAAALLINLLVLLGVVVDPTTAGASDSDKAMGYDAPRPETDTEADEDEMEV